MTSSVLVAGLGNIGLAYDLRDYARDAVLTHAAAFAAHPAFELAGGVDPLAAPRRQFETAYGKPAWSDLGEALRAVAPEIVVVALPTEGHRQAVLDILATLRPRAIVCEKPLAYDADEAAAIVEACNAAGVRLFVNYMRRADPAVREIKRRIECRAIELPVSGVVWYSGGLFNSASHAADLCGYWFGRIGGARCLADETFADARDPRPAFAARFGDSCIRFLPAGRDGYFVNSVEVLAGNGRLHYDLSGFASWQATMPSPLYAGYRNLAPAGEALPCEPRKSQWFFVDELAKALAGAPCSLTGGEEARHLLCELTQLKRRPTRDEQP